MRRARKEPKSLDAIETLSDRELQVFRLIGKGRSTRQVAAELCLSVKTVETHRAHIKEKLGLPTGLDLVRHAIESNTEGLF
jgi:DNA-binding NarL/FixJ family response regulator